MADKTFIKITNKDIYRKLEDIESSIISINERVTAHTGCINLNKWMAATALGLATSIAIALIKMIWS